MLRSTPSMMCPRPDERRHDDRGESRATEHQPQFRGALVTERRWAYVPFDAPTAFSRIDVSTSHDRISLLGVAATVGSRIWAGRARRRRCRGIRGRSGGARAGFSLSRTDPHRETRGPDRSRRGRGRWDRCAQPARHELAGTVVCIAVAAGHSDAGEAGHRHDTQPRNRFVRGICMYIPFTRMVAPRPVMRDRRQGGWPGFRRVDGPQHQLRQPSRGRRGHRRTRGCRGGGDHPARPLAGGRAAVERLGHGDTTARRSIRPLRHGSAGDGGLVVAATGRCRCPVQCGNRLPAA